MKVEIILVSVSCVISLLNLVSILFLSNAIFRIISPAKIDDKVKLEDSGLVDPAESLTYDPRFKS